MRGSAASVCERYGLNASQVGAVAWQYLAFQSRWRSFVQRMQATRLIVEEADVIANPTKALLPTIARWRAFAQARNLTGFQRHYEKAASWQTYIMPANITLPWVRLGQVSPSRPRNFNVSACSSQVDLTADVPACAADVPRPPPDEVRRCQC